MNHIIQIDVSTDSFLTSNLMTNWELCRLIAHHTSLPIIEPDFIHDDPTELFSKNFNLATQHNAGRVKHWIFME